MLPLVNVILMPHLTVTITAFLHQSTVHPAAPICLNLMHIDAAKLAFYKFDTLAMVQQRQHGHFWADAVIFPCISFP